jgi:hypothetical protein
VDTVNTIHLIVVNAEGMLLTEMKKEVQKCQDAIGQRLPLGGRIAVSVLNANIRSQGFTEVAMSKALSFMRAKGIVEYSNQGKTITRISM